MRKSFVIFWAAIIILILFFWIYFPVLSHYRDLRIQEDKLSRDLAELDAKIRALTEEKNLLLHDVEYLEKVIRDEMGLVKPGEIVYKLVPDTGTGTAPAPPVLPGPSAPSPRSSPKPKATAL